LLDGVRAAPGAARRTVYAPFTGKPLADLPLSEPQDVRDAVERARRAQRIWSGTSLGERAAVMLRLHDLLLDRRAEALDLLQLEVGKARRDATEEVLDVAHAARYAARLGRSLLRPQRRRSVAPGVLSASVHLQPKGVVGVITPWNYPLALLVNDAAPALMAGNALVIKPDEQTSLITLWVASLMRAAGVPDDAVQVVTGDGPVIGGAVIDHVDYVAFTGSTETGRAVAERAAPRLIGTSLELGGKNAAIVCADANLAKAARGLATGSFANAGQLCQTFERIYVVDAIYDDFRAAFLREVDGLHLSPALDYSGDVGSLVSAEHLAKVCDHVDEAVAAGARVITGGRARPDIGPYFYEPTVMEGVTDQMRVCCEETFGPVVALYRVPDEAAAVAAANNSAHGLNASVWSRDIGRAKAIAARLRAGTVHVNDGYTGIWATIDAPMGGVLDSGLGRRNGREGLLRYTEPQSVVVQRFLQLGGPPGERYEGWAKLLTGYVRALKAMGVR
jgi:acyl-CoA reductase-like NAD-dependent aldehyde dehydrogenase